MHSAWKTRHDLAEDACPECQGSTYVPGPMYDERMVNECPECKGTGKDATKKSGVTWSFRPSASYLRIEERELEAASGQGRD